MTLDKLKHELGVHHQEASGFVLMLTKMAVGDKFTTPIASLVKTGESTFELQCTEADIDKLTDEWIDNSVDPIMAIFERNND